MKSLNDTINTNSNTCSDLISDAKQRINNLSKAFFALLFLLIAGALPAQEDFRDESDKDKDKQMETLFNNKYSFGGYGAPEIKFTTVNEKYGLMVGGHGGFILNHSLIFGGGGYGLTTNSRFNDDTLNILMGYGGLRMEYVCCSHKLVHFSIPVLIGGGGAGVAKETKDIKVEVNYSDDEDVIDEDNWSTIESSGFFVVEPGLNLEFNIIKYFRITMGASYRYVAGTDLYYISDSDLSDVSFNLGFKFGVF